MADKTIAVLFGGRSVEHEVSVITGHQAMDALEHAGFKVLPIYITKQGDWYVGKELHNLELYQTRRLDVTGIDGVQRASLSPDRSVRQLVRHPRAAKRLFSKTPELWADVFFPAIHGTFGEDGTLQGLFEMADVPYVGPGVLAAAIGMDKVRMKEVYLGRGLPMLECLTVDRRSWDKDKDTFIAQVEATLAYPVIVKPVNLGSSIGVSRCGDRPATIEAIELALSIDMRVLVETALVDFIEINCSVLGPPARASVCEQPARREEVLSFSDKYKHGGKKLTGQGPQDQGMAGLARIVPAPIDDALTRRVQDISVEAFRSIDASGVARIDFLYDRATERLYLNEINTTPGSLAFYLWEAGGMMFGELVTTLVDIAPERHRLRTETAFDFAANLLAR